MSATNPRRNRSRRAPEPNGQRTKITDNDIFGIFEPLSRYAQLTTKQLVAYDRRYAQRTRDRLTALFHDDRKWLRRLSQETTFANYLARDELYQLAEEGALLLISKGLLPNAEWVFNSRVGGNSTMPSRLIRLAHDHMASDIALDIEIGARGAAAPFLNHIEIIKTAPAAIQKLKYPLRVPVPDVPGAPKWIEPDALFSLGGRYYALEADMNTESIPTIIHSKIIAYREIVSACVIDEHLGIDNLTVLFVTINEQRMRAIKEELRGIARDGRSKMFAFACRPDLANFLKAPAPTGRMFTLPWERVGYDNLSFDGNSPQFDSRRHQ
ncbi:replication-relaxation family protein [Methylocystis sp.]|uniref:replication-relaxation family protein n=1 Tax=Methylocystis sp. TaxID=1911079 RepID=UPI003DA3DB04